MILYDGDHTYKGKPLFRAAISKWLFAHHANEPTMADQYFSEQWKYRPS